MTRRQRSTDGLGVGDGRVKIGNHDAHVMKCLEDGGFGHGLRVRGVGRHARLAVTPLADASKVWSARGLRRIHCQSRIFVTNLVN